MFSSRSISTYNYFQLKPIFIKHVPNMSSQNRLWLNYIASWYMYDCFRKWCLGCICARVCVWVCQWGCVLKSRKRLGVTWFSNQSQTSKAVLVKGFEQYKGAQGNERKQRKKNRKRTRHRTWSSEEERSYKRRKDEDFHPPHPLFCAVCLHVYRR